MKDNIDIEIDVAYKWDVILTLAGTNTLLAYVVFITEFPANWAVTLL